MWRANLPALLERRTAYCVDLLGDAGLSVQIAPLESPEDQAQWFDEMLIGLELNSAHLMGVSFGGWTATNYAVLRPGRAASLTLQDPVMTFARIPLKTMLLTCAMTSPGVPEVVRRRIMRWLAGGAEIDDSVPRLR
jgi:pimeloyl-ACP methyl ester carboxylesterase